MRVHEESVSKAPRSGAKFASLNAWASGDWGYDFVEED
jgi:hypothetical protein